MKNLLPLPERSAYPMMVVFGDLSDPTSVTKVNPDDLAATFGKGVKLKRVTVELTGDPLTTRFGARLRWLSVYPEPGLKPGHGLKDFSLPATLRHGDFQKGGGS